MNVKFMWILVAITLSSGCAAHRIRESHGQAEFYLNLPPSRQVLFACSLDGFVLHEARRSWRSEWVAAVPAGKVFRYFYLVDGQVYLPPCPYREKDDFGSENCIYLPEP
jgi:hypothetical protein